MRVEAVVMAPPLIIALVRGETSSAWGFGAAICALLVTSLVTRSFRPKSYEFYARDGFLIVALAWIVVSLFGAIPFSVSGVTSNYMDSLFEMISGFTTTGATILRDIETTPMSLLYWRSFSVWLGGMGVLVFVLAIIPLSRNTGHSMHLLRAESPGPQVDKIVPRMHNYAKMLYTVYIVMTLIEFILLTAGGMPLFDSITTAFATAGTGGFGILNDSMASYSLYLQNVVTVFMILFGINFNIFYLLVIREFGKILKNEELWLYLGVIAAAVAAVTMNVVMMFESIAHTLHHAVFQVASIITSTGFSTVDFNLWPQFSRTVLVLLMVFGACAGSTGGGLKMARVLLLGKAFVRDLRRLMRPRSVSLVKLNGHVVEEDTIRATQSFLAAYLFVMLISVALVSLNSFTVETTVTSVVACLNNIGPGLDVVGPMGHYADFSGLSKLVLAADMLIGRLEIYPILMLFAPAVWRG
jgi:trk system potassium uptake protein TrkH